jgi:electron transport complex protein RnfD
MNTNFNGVSRQNLGIETAPHLKAPLTTKMIMGIVSLCLLPAFVVQIFFFGFGNFFQFINCLVTAVICEVVVALLRHRSVLHSLSDLSYLVTAALLGMTLPPLLPCYYAVVATVFAIIVVKAVFGGLGNNIFNPAMAGFVFIVISSPSAVGLSWVAPAPYAFSVATLEKTAEVIYDKENADNLKKDIDALNITLLDKKADSTASSNDTDATTGATFLEEIKSARKSGTLYKKTDVDFHSSEYLAYFCLAIAYLLGGIALIAFKIILVKMVVVFFVSIVAFSLILSHIFPGYFLPPLDTLLFGGTMMAAFFIITDPVTNAGTSKGRIYFSILVAFLIVLLRAFGSYSDAVAFAVMLSNAAAPLIDVLTHRRPFGYRYKKGGLQ